MQGVGFSSLCRGDLHLTRSRRALRATGKGDKTRIVYLSQFATDAVAAYLGERDRHLSTIGYNGSLTSIISVLTERDCPQRNAA